MWSFVQGPPQALSNEDIVQGIHRTHKLNQDMRDRNGRSLIQVVNDRDHYALTDYMEVENEKLLRGRPVPKVLPLDIGHPKIETIYQAKMSRIREIGQANKKETCKEY